MYFQ